MNLKKITAGAMISAVLGYSTLASAATCTDEFFTPATIVQYCGSYFYLHNKSSVHADLRDSSPAYPIYTSARVRGLKSNGDIISGCDKTDTSVNDGWANDYSGCGDAVGFKAYVTFLTAPR